MEKFLRYLIFCALLISITVTSLVLVLPFGQPKSLAYLGNGSPLDKQVSDNLAGWVFTYTISPSSDGGYWVTRDYTLSSNDIAVAAKAMNQAAGDFARQGAPFMATLVFAKPVPVADFLNFAHTTGIHPSSSFLQANHGTSELSVPASANEALDLAKINELANGPHNPLTGLGVITTDVVLDAGTYAKIVADDRVYAFDVTSELMLAKIKQQDPAVQTSKVQIARSLLYDDMQKAGIAP